MAANASETRYPTHDIAPAGAGAAATTPPHGRSFSLSLGQVGGVSLLRCFLLVSLLRCFLDMSLNQRPLLLDDFAMTPLLTEAVLPISLCFVFVLPFPVWAFRSQFHFSENCSSIRRDLHGVLDKVRLLDIPDGLFFDERLFE